MIKINHLIYYRTHGNTKHHYLIIQRKLWDFKHKRRNIKRSIYTPFVDHRFIELLHKYYNEWHYVPSLIYNENIIEFTVGFDEETGIKAIAITHPHDNFNKKIGTSIVKGRIKRQRGDLVGRTKYNPLPKTMYDPSVREEQ